MRRATPGTGSLGLTIFMVAGSLLAPPGARAADTSDPAVECRVVQETADGLYVDAGRERGLVPGNVGGVERDGDEIARVEVVSSSKTSALLRIVSYKGLDRPRMGDRVVVQASGQVAGAQKPAGEADKKPAAGPNEPFVPLLAPPELSVGLPQTSNIFHGRLRVREMFQMDSKSNLDYSITRGGTDGSLDRIAGTPWAAEWSGDLSYRSGSAFDGTEDDQDLRLDVYRLSLYRRFEKGGFLRLGRFLPRELPAVGFLDGVQDEVVVSDHFRLGAMAGLKPDRRDLEFSVKEPTAVAYGTVEGGKRQSLYYSGTLGVLGSMYEGKADRLALLLDQRADLCPKLSLFSTSQVDFDTGAFLYRSGPRLSHVDLYAVSPITSFFTLRGGFDHSERPDTRAERDQLSLNDPRYFDRGYWRYWIGGTERLPWNLTVDEEVAFIDAPSDGDTPRWRVSLTRYSLPVFPQGQITLTAYNLVGADAEGYGFLATAYLPVLDGRLSFRPSAGLRWVDTSQTAASFQVTDLSLYGDWWISKSWSAFAGATWSFGDSLDRTLVEIGVEFHW